MMPLIFSILVATNHPFWTDIKMDKCPVYLDPKPGDVCVWVDCNECKLIHDDAGNYYTLCTLKGCDPSVAKWERGRPSRERK